MTPSTRTIAFLFWLSTTLILCTYVFVLDDVSVAAVNTISWFLGAVNGIAGYVAFHGPKPESEGG